MHNLNFSVNLLAQNAPYSLIRAAGADAASFLQGQLTQDVLLLKPQELRLAAWCSAKGRMLASFWLWKTIPDEIFLLTSRDTAAATLKRLKMFVLRAKCSLGDVTEQFVLNAQVSTIATDSIAGSAMNTLATGLNDINSELQSLHYPEFVWQGLRIKRCLQLATSASDEQFANETALSLWQSLEVMSGIARITTPVVEAFVPQMLNYESVGGVNFKKGCYPGQEVVARSQFRGAIKRRAYLLSCAQPLQAGQEVFSESELDQPCGLIAHTAATLNAPGFIAMASLQTSAADQSLHLGSAQGALLSRLELPYALLEDI